MNMETLLEWDTVYSADSVEWCPIPPHENIFVCGTYQLAEHESQQDAYKRLGRLYLFMIDTTENLKHLQTIEMPAILDIKWCQRKIIGKILLAIANAAGGVEIYKLDSEKCSLVLLCSRSIADCGDETLALSLDWSEGRENAMSSPCIVVSNSRGGISLLKLDYVSLMVTEQWKAHDFEAWIAAFDYWNTNVIYSGGDDCKLKVNDTRTRRHVQVCKHEAGVTSLHANAVHEHILASGRMGNEEDVSPALEELEVVSDVEDSKPLADQTADKSPVEINKKVEVKESSVSAPEDSYNGAVLDNYRWSQTISDIDIQIPVPAHITKARDVRVNVLATSMSVSVKGGGEEEWLMLMEGDLSWKNNKQESLWSLEPGKHIQVHLEKMQERWWESLLVSEPKIDLSKIDAHRPMEDLAQDEQMKIQELMWNQECKEKGLPTSDQMRTEKILKEAWSKEGSPFLGTEYDPSVINFGNSCADISIEPS